MKSTLTVMRRGSIVYLVPVRSAELNDSQSLADVLTHRDVMAAATLSARSLLTFY
jgi:hypothetical protein